jgi:hypothetical protein
LKGNQRGNSLHWRTTGVRRNGRGCARPLFNVLRRGRYDFDRTVFLIRRHDRREDRIAYEAIVVVTVTMIGAIVLRLARFGCATEMNASVATCLNVSVSTVSVSVGVGVSVVRMPGLRRMRVGVERRYPHVRQMQGEHGGSQEPRGQTRVRHSAHRTKARPIRFRQSADLRFREISRGTFLPTPVRPLARQTRAPAAVLACRLSPHRSNS